MGAEYNNMKIIIAILVAATVVHAGPINKFIKPLDGCGSACTSASNCSGACPSCILGVCTPGVKKVEKPLDGCGSACTSASNCSGACPSCILGVCTPGVEKVEKPLDGCGSACTS